MQNEIITIQNYELELSKDFISDTKKVEEFVKKLDELGKTVLDLSTKDKIKEAKQINTNANKFIGQLKEFCEPLEEEGKRIGKARSLISTKIDNKSQKSVIVKLLAPIKEREEKIKVIKDQLFIPSQTAESNQLKIETIEELSDYDWLGFAEEILPVIEKQKNFLLNEKIKFDQEAKAKIEAENLARIERENQIRLEAEVKAKADAQKAIDEANERAKQAEIKVEAIQVAKTPFSPIAPAVPSSSDIESQKIVHRKILSDLMKFGFFASIEDATSFISSIYRGKIKNLVIKY